MDTIVIDYPKIEDGVDEAYVRLSFEIVSDKFSKALYYEVLLFHHIFLVNDRLLSDGVIIPIEQYDSLYNTTLQVFS